MANGNRGIVASVHPLASQAAYDAFQRGGNAIDAAVAASLMLSVVDGHNSGLGGGCLALIHRADGTVIALDGREQAPAGATPEMFFRNGQPAPELSQLGLLAAGVPGLLAALEKMSRQYGLIDRRKSVEDAAQIAEDGFEISENYAACSNPPLLTCDAIQRRLEFCLMKLDNRGPLVTNFNRWI